jgi:predicted GIY-YIG superfamily endonuclease
MTGEVFAALRPIFEPLVETLKTKPPDTVLPKHPGRYVLKEGRHYMYVGITRNLHRRWQGHRYGRETGATFAIRLAREKTGRLAKYTESEGLR